MKATERQIELKNFKNFTNGNIVMGQELGKVNPENKFNNYTALLVKPIEAKAKRRIL